MTVRALLRAQHAVFALHFISVVQQRRIDKA